MDIIRVRKARPSLKMGTLVEEILEDETLISDPFSVAKVEQGLQQLKKYDFTFDGSQVVIFESKTDPKCPRTKRYSGRRTSNAYNAYAYIRDYLGVGSVSPFLISAMESKYPQVTKKCFRRRGPVSYEKLDKIAVDILTFLKEYILTPSIA